MNLAFTQPITTGARYAASFALAAMLLGTPGTTVQAQNEVASSTPRPTLIVRPASSWHGDGAPGGGFNSESPSDQSIIHIVSGRSRFIDTNLRLARVYVTNPAVLDTYTSNPNQVIITAKEPGTSTLILWDESGELKTYLVYSDIDVQTLSDSIKQAMPHETIHVEGDQGRIVLTGTVGTQAIADSAVKIASLYSKDVSDSLVVNAAGVQQVRLEVRIVEVDRSKLSSFGFNFFSAGGNNLATTSTTQYPSTLSVTSAGATTGGSTVGGKSVQLANPLNFSLYNSHLNIGATLQDLETMQVLQILAEPNITTLSGVPASFLAGGEFPFPVVQGTTLGGASVSIEFRPYGVKLDFTPTVNADGTIELHVAPEVSALDYTNAVTIAGYTIPAISTRRADTQVVLKSGQTFAISGLLDRRTTDLYSKTPGIASVPLLGELFKSKSTNHSFNELIVIVTPTIVNPLTNEAAQPTEPAAVVPYLNPKTFDKDLPAAAKK